MGTCLGEYPNRCEGIGEDKNSLASIGIGTTITQSSCLQRTDYILPTGLSRLISIFTSKKNVQINLYRSQIIYILRNLHILYNNTAEFVLTEETPLCLRNQKSQKCLQQYCTCGTKLRFQLQKSGCLWRIYTSNKIKQIRVIISLQHTRSLGTWLIEVNIDITFYDLSLYVHTSTEVITFTGCS